MTASTKELYVALRNEFSIELPSNRTTGYEWEADYDNTIVRLSASNYKRESEKAGSGGTESFTFIAHRKGKTLIRLLYKRPWDKTISREALYAVTIED